MKNIIFYWQESSKSSSIGQAYRYLTIKNLTPSGLTAIGWIRARAPGLTRRISRDSRGPKRKYPSVSILSAAKTG